MFPPGTFKAPPFFPWESSKLSACLTIAADMGFAKGKKMSARGALTSTATQYSGGINRGTVHVK
jgi:hypothetical protein